MPRVPVAENTVGIAQATGGRISAPDMRGGALAGIGEGLQRLGAVGMDYARDQRRQQLDQAQTSASEADIAFAAYSTEMQNDPQAGIYSKRGRDAVQAYGGTIDNLTTRRREIEKGLPNAEAKRLFGRMADQRMMAYQAGLSRYVSDQDRHWKAEASVAAIGANVADGITNYQNPAAQGVAIERVVHEYAVMADREGLPEEVGIANAREKVSGIRLASVQRYAESDPAGAQAYLNEHKAQIVGTDLAQAERSIRIGTDRQEADARRIAAEQRAQEAHDRSLRRETLATVKVQLDSGAGTYADWGALADGYAAIGDTSAAAGARQKATELKTVEGYRGAPLARMDTRLAELRGKPSLTSTEAAEVNGLTTLRQQTATRLDQTGGALAQYEYATGRPLAPLNVNDPASYRSRAGQAITAAQTYGRRVIEPLTQTEVEPLKDLVAGDSGKRLMALQAISKFGDPRAIDGAARQIAGKDDGAFRIAATLAVLPGDVGYQAARDILRGTEALKTNGTVYQPKAGELTFATFAAPALRGLAPDYAADVMDAARNLYAARMTTAGQTQWNEAAWRSALDTAMGSYRKDGVKYGGIADLRGSPVSIPPGWTGEGVFRRIARASGAEFSGAAVSRAPQWPDGTRVYSGQLRDLTPVRVGGTRYGFQTRNGRMLGAEGGGPYVIDLARVPWHD